MGLRQDIDDLKEALDNIEKLNLTDPDEDGIKWNKSDLVANEIEMSRSIIERMEERL